MAKKPVDVNAMLGNLLNNLDKGVDLEKVGKKPAKKKEKTLMDEAIATPRLNKPSLTTKRLVLRVNRVTCECCGAVHEHVNKHVLVEKVDKWGNLLQTQFVSVDDMDAPRAKDIIESTSANCLDCFWDGEIQPVTTDEAGDSIEPVTKPNVDDLLALVDSKLEK